MDGSNFDAWTRRRFGLAAGGFAGSLLGVVHLSKADAGKRKRRCKRLDQGCKPQGKKRKCCTGKGLQCQPESLSGRNRCCRKGGEPCSTETASQCCSGTCTNQQCFCKSVGAPCGENRHCCSGKCNTGGDFHCLPA